MSRLLLGVLSDAEIETIHEKTLTLLETVGLKVMHEEALRKLAAAGASVEPASGLVRFDRRLITELLAQAPPVARETGLNGRVLEAGGENRYYLSLILDPFVIDHETGPRRPVLEDVRRHTIVGESLERVSSMMRMQYPVADVPGSDSYYKTMEVFLSHTTKHTAAYPSSEENCRDWMDVMSVIAEAADLSVEDSPLLSIAMAVTSPLQITRPNVEMMKMAMERCYPIISTVCPMAGATSPYSLAGTLLLGNAEALAPVLIAQVYRPGHPVFYTIAPSVMDMRHSHDLYYKAEKMLWKTASAQMGRFYRLPVSGEAGGSLVWRADAQFGAESLAYLLAAVGGGQNIIGGLGSLHNANGMSAEAIIIQCGLADMAEYLARGMDVDELKLGLKSIAEAGPGGNFMTDELTLRLLRSREFFESLRFDLIGGHKPDAPGMIDLARREVESIVADHRPQLSGKVREAIHRFFAVKYQDKRLAE